MVPRVAQVRNSRGSLRFRTPRAFGCNRSLSELGDRERFYGNIVAGPGPEMGTGHAWHPHKEFKLVGYTIYEHTLRALV